MSAARPAVVRTYGARQRKREDVRLERAIDGADKENVEVTVRAMGIKQVAESSSPDVASSPTPPPSSALPGLTFSSSPVRPIASRKECRLATPAGTDEEGAAFALEPGVMTSSSPPPASPTCLAKRARVTQLDGAIKGQSQTQPGRNTMRHSALVPQPRKSAGTAAERKPLRQLHLVPVRRLPHTQPATSASRSAPTRQPVSSLYTTCTLCGMTYVRGGVGEEDEVIHRRHCARVAAGVVWSEGRGSGSGGSGDGEAVREVVCGQDKNSAGRIVCLSGGAAKQNKKLAQVLDMVDTVLSSPSLPDATLAKCKVYLLVTSAPPPASMSGTVKKRPRPGGPGASAAELKRDRVVGCVVAQEIQWAMEVVESARGAQQDEGVSIDKAHEEKYVVVDPAGAEGAADLGVMCHPTRLSTRLGIHRLFILPAYRGQHLAGHLLDAACANTVYGHTCDPRTGEVAFSQPTGAGRAVMQRWGGGKVRVFVEDEQE